LTNKKGIVIKAVVNKGERETVKWRYGPGPNDNKGCAAGTVL